MRKQLRGDVVFDLRDRPVSDSVSCTCNFIKIADARIEPTVESALTAAAFWLEPLLQLNPTVLPEGTIDALDADHTLHPACAKTFRIDKSGTDHSGKEPRLHTHQHEGILQAKEGQLYVLTSASTVRT